MPDSKDLKDKAESIFGRFNHPFLGSFITSWVFFNWDILYCLWGGTLTPISTIQYVKNTYFVWANTSHLFLVPFASMLIYVFAGPFLISFHVWYKNFLDVKRRHFEAITNLERPVSQAEYLQKDSKIMSLTEELTNYRIALGAIKHGMVRIPGGSSMEIQNLIADYRRVMDENSRLTAENANLRTEQIKS